MDHHIFNIRKDFKFFEGGFYRYWLLKFDFQDIISLIQLKFIESNWTDIKMMIYKYISRWSNEENFPIYDEIYLFSSYFIIDQNQNIFII